MSGADLARMFGKLRCQMTGAGLEWFGNPMAPEKAATMAAMVADMKLLEMVEPTMREFFRLGLAGELRESKRILKHPAFAFACWCTQFPELVESLRGQGPSLASKPQVTRPLYDPGTPMTQAQLDEMARERRAMKGG